MTFSPLHCNKEHSSRRTRAPPPPVAYQSPPSPPSAHNIKNPPPRRQWRQSGRHSATTKPVELPYERAWPSPSSSGPSHSLEPPRGWWDPCSCYRRPMGQASFAAKLCDYAVESISIPPQQAGFLFPPPCAITRSFVRHGGS